MNYLESEVKKYYEGYDEDRRLIKDNSHSVEFITTTKYLDKYIHKGDNIIELGAGTGIYSFYYAKKECFITALELSEKHVNIMENKLKDTSLNMNIVQGNALDLSQFDSESYDCVLCLGPMYHLTNKEDRTKCMSECLKLLKPGGLIAVSYINKFSHFVDMINRNKEDINDKGLHNIVENGVEFGDLRDCFYFSTYEEIEEMMNDNKIEKTVQIGTDGISDMIRSRVNEFTDSEFELWMKYHLETCENPSLIGYSKHGLYIGRKK